MPSLKAFAASAALLLPLSFLGQQRAEAYPWSYSSYGYGNMSTYSVSGPGGYYGSGTAMRLGRNIGTASYFDSEGGYYSSTCMRIGRFLSCNSY